MRPCRIILIGMMGSGKSTVGRLLAARTGWPFHDNDALLRELTGRTPRDILAAAGETALLSAEVAALTDGLARAAPSVVAAAGGTIQDEAARDRTRAAGCPVWLRVSAATSLARSYGGSHRPWPDEDRAAWIRAAIQRRHPLYESVAILTLDADEADPSAIADLILGDQTISSACGLDPAAPDAGGLEHHRHVDQDQLAGR